MFVTRELSQVTAGHCWVNRKVFGAEVAECYYRYAWLIMKE